MEPEIVTAPPIDKSTVKLARVALWIAIGLNSSAVVFDLAIGHHYGEAGLSAVIVVGLTGWMEILDAFVRPRLEAELAQQRAMVAHVELANANLKLMEAVMGRGPFDVTTRVN
jgi:hypothetical protein